MTIVGIGEIPIVPSFGPQFAAKVNAGATTGLSGLPGVASKVGKAAGIALVAGTVATLGGLAKLGEEFDKEYDKIRVGTGKTGDSLKGLEKSFKNVIKDVPVSFGQAGDAITGISQRLNLTGKPLEEMAKRVTVLNEVVGGDMKEQIAATTRVMGDWAISTDKMPATLDKLFRASQKTGIPIEQLSQQIVKFGAPLRQLGFSFDESAALIGKFEKEGVNSSLVLGSMRIALGKMAKAGEPAQETFNRITTEIKNAGSASEANKKALELFGARAGPDMAAAIREGRFEIGALVKDIAGGSDTILKAGKDTEEFGEKWKQLRNRIAVALEPAAVKVFDALGIAMDWIGETAGPKVAEIFDRIRDKLAPVGLFIENIVTVAGDLFELFRSGDSDAQTFAEIMTQAFGENSLELFRNLYNAAVAFGDGVRDAFHKAEPALKTFATDLIPIIALPAHFDAIKDAVTRGIDVIKKYPELLAILGAGILHFAIPALISLLSAQAAATAGWIAETAAMIAANAPLIAVSLLIGALVAGVIYAYRHFAVFHDAVNTVAAALKTALGVAVRFIVDLWNNYLLPAGKAVVSFMVDTLWPQIQRVWDDISQVIVFAWQKIIQPIFHAISWVLTTIVIPAINFLGTVAKAMFSLWWAIVQEAWEIIRPIFAAIVDVVETKIVPILKVLAFVGGIVFVALKDAVTDAWHVIEPVLTAIWNFVKDKLTPVWDAMVAAAKLAWNALPGLISAALRGVGSLVSGFLGGVATIADAIGLDHIAGVLRDGANAAKGWGQEKTDSGGVGGGGHFLALATGGQVPGPNVKRDIVPAMLTPGEFVIRQDSVQKFGKEFFEQLNGGQMPGFAKGGLIPHIPGPDLIGGAVRGARKLGSAALEKVWPLLGVPDNITGIAAGGANYARQAIIDLIRGKEAEQFSAGNAGNMPGQVADWVRAAMEFVGVPANWFEPLMARVKLESGGNPAAINLWDSNAKAGHPSMGMWQMIMSTFLAHAVPGHGNIWNPIDEGISALRYIIARYGSIFNTNPRTGYHDGGYVHGRSFDEGGVLRPGWNKVYNGTGDDEDLRPPGRGGGGAPLIGVAHFNTRESVAEFYQRAEFENSRRSF